MKSLVLGIASLSLLCGSPSWAGKREAADHFEASGANNVGVLHIQYKDKDGKVTGETNCTGTLVGHRLVLSAAECMDRTKKNPEGTFSLHKRGDKSTAESKLMGMIVTDMHKDVGKTDIGTNVALFVLQEPMGDRFGHLNVSDTNPEEKSELRVIGYSKDFEEGKKAFQEMVEASSVTEFDGDAKSSDKEEGEQSGNYLISAKFGEGSVGSPVLRKVIQKLPEDYKGPVRTEADLTSWEIVGVVTSKGGEQARVNSSVAIWTQWVMMNVSFVYDDLGALYKDKTFKAAIDKVAGLDEENAKVAKEADEILSAAIKSEQDAIKKQLEGDKKEATEEAIAAKLDVQKILKGLPKGDLDKVQKGSRIINVQRNWDFILRQWPTLKMAQRRQALQERILAPVYAPAKEGEEAEIDVDATRDNILQSMRVYQSIRSEVIMPKPNRILGVQAGLYFPVRVQVVVPKSAAEKAGVKVGDMILEVNGQTPTSMIDLRTAVAKGEETVKIKVLRLKEGETPSFDLALTELAITFDADTSKLKLDSIKDDEDSEEKPKKDEPKKEDMM